MGGEEHVMGMYGKITADLSDFESAMSDMQKQLDEMERQQLSVQKDTKSTETGFAMLGMEFGALQGALAAVYQQLQRSSGGVSAITDMFSGIIGAGFDTFLSKVLIPLWEQLTGAESENVNQMELTNNELDALTQQLKLNTDGTVGFAEGANILNHRLLTLHSAANMGAKYFDEMGNTIIQVGDGFLVFNTNTGKALGTIDTLNVQLDETLALMNGMEPAYAAIAEQHGILVDELQLAMTEGVEAVRALYDPVNDPENWPGKGYFYQVKLALQEAKKELAIFLVQLGIDPGTGESLIGPQGKARRISEAGATMLGTADWMQYYGAGQ